MIEEASAGAEVIRTSPARFRKGWAVPKDIRNIGFVPCLYLWKKYCIAKQSPRREGVKRAHPPDLT
jgi:hypothetical protein